MRHMRDNEPYKCQRKIWTRVCEHYDLVLSEVPFCDIFYITNGIGNPKIAIIPEAQEDTSQIGLELFEKGFGYSKASIDSGVLDDPDNGIFELLHDWGVLAGQQLHLFKVRVT